MEPQDLFFNFTLHYLEGGLANLQAGEVTPDPTRPYTTILYLMSGNCEIAVNEQRTAGKAGDFFYLPANTAYSVRIPHNTEVNHYYFRFSLQINQKQPEELIGLPRHFPLGINEEIKAICDRILSCAEPDSPIGILEQKTSLMELISFYISLNEFGSEAAELNGKSQALARVTDYINHHLDRKITLNDLADATYLHPNYLCRLFKKQLGTSPIRYVLRRKMEYAAHLLNSTQLPIGDIAALTGYDDTARFSADFKKQFSHTPTRYRTSVSDSNESKGM